MSSVRVRSSQYASWTDRPAPDQQRTPTNIFRRPTLEPSSDTPEPATSPLGSPVITRPSDHRSPLLMNLPAAPLPTIIVDQPIAALRRGRPRAGSRPREWEPPVRQASIRSLGGSNRTTSYTHFCAIDGVLTIERTSADTQVHSDDGEPGLVRSALSLPHFDEANASYQLYHPLDDHRHDDIDEHLDVTDTGVATVLNLTNAANSIIIKFVVLDPPLGEDDWNPAKRKDSANFTMKQLKFKHHKIRYRPHGTATHRAFPIKYLLVAFKWSRLFYLPQHTSSPTTALPTMVAGYLEAKATDMFWKFIFLILIWACKDKIGTGSQALWVGWRVVSYFIKERL
ncbi:hypothetical protein EDD18DRAFT_1400049 [Armillaria luteobubalina]|uniref:Uncharacterized protein n=1 Tax=Armillaria luteobubalina TaxID=153913 RepID=A0AA39UVU2_9AGAR|nr:hypothetical protein EDD18DRAFT_1400049 [Armillaria luteobubalina]